MSYLDRDDDDYPSMRCERCREPLGTGGPGADVCCDCGAIYNAFGQRLRDDLYTRPNPSDHDDDIDDMTGYEIAMGHDN